MGLSRQLVIFGILIGGYQLIQSRSRGKDLEGYYNLKYGAESAGEKVRNRLQGSDVGPEDDMLENPSIYRDWPMVQKGYQSLRMMNDNDNFDGESFEAPHAFGDDRCDNCERSTITDQDMVRMPIYSVGSAGSDSWDQHDVCEECHDKLIYNRDDEDPEYITEPEYRDLNFNAGGYKKFGSEWHYFAPCETAGCDGSIEYRDVYACPTCGQDDVEILIEDTCPDCGEIAYETSKYAIFYCSDCEEDYTDMYNAEGMNAEDAEAGSFRDGTGCISQGSFPSMTCEYCGFNPHDLVYYQCKQNDEDLTWDEWQKELEFYFYEGSHSEQCQGLIDEMGAEESFEDFQRRMVGDAAIAGDMGYMEALEEYYQDYLEEFEKMRDEVCPDPKTFEQFQEMVLKDDFAFKAESEHRKCTICEEPAHPLYRGKGLLEGARRICYRCNKQAMKDRPSFNNVMTFDAEEKCGDRDAGPVGRPCKLCGGYPCPRCNALHPSENDSIWIEEVGDVCLGCTTDAEAREYYFINDLLGGDMTRKEMFEEYPERKDAIVKHRYPETRWNAESFDAENHAQKDYKKIQKDLNRFIKTLCTCKHSKDAPSALNITTSCGYCGEEIDEVSFYGSVQKSILEAEVIQECLFCDETDAEFIEVILDGYPELICEHCVLKGDMGAESFGAHVYRGKPMTELTYSGRAMATKKMIESADVEQSILQLESAIRMGLISEEDIMDQLQKKFGSK